MTNNPQSFNKTRYQFIPRVLVFLTRGDEVLLMKRADDRPVFPGLYNGLGGHVERSESVLAAAYREIEEEAGLRPSRLWLCANVAIDTGDPAVGIHMSVFCGPAPQDSELRQSDEGTLQWVKVSELSDLKMVEDIPTLLPKVLAVPPDGKPLWALYTYDDAGKLHMQFEDN
ncbi:MAG: NUDIX domain-containing protein [Anaerolineales bacterium]|nr:NUDIX domain-containing protein [Anaerolineales bacterium]